MSDSLRPHQLQHARPPCPSPTPRACSNSCPSSQRCHPTISPSVVPFSSCLQSFPASGSFQMSVLCIRWPKYWSFSLEVISSAYLTLLMFLPPILIPAYNSSSPAFLMMCSAYKLNKQGDNRQLCHSFFLILNQSVVPYRVLTVASRPTYRFHRRQVGDLVFPSL